MEEQKTNLSDVWNVFHKSVASQIESNVGYHKKFYENVSEKWLNFSNVLGTTISEAMNENRDGMQDIYNLWKNYQNKMHAKIERVYETETQRSRGMLDIWNENGRKIFHMMTESSGKDEGNDDFYSMWVDVTASMTKEINHAVADTNGECKELTKTWFEFLDKIKAEISALDQSNPKGEEIRKTAQSMSMAMSHELSDYISACTKSAVNFQINWMNMLTSTRHAFSKLLPEINYEELYSDFLERNTIGPFGTVIVSRTKMRRLENEVLELTTRILELEKTAKI